MKSGQGPYWELYENNIKSLDQVFMQFTLRNEPMVGSGISEISFLKEKKKIQPGAMDLETGGSKV